MKDTTITIRISEQEKEILKTMAKEKDIPVSQIIREAIRKTIQEEKTNDN